MSLPAQRYRDLEEAVADAAGVSAVVDSIERSVGSRARSAVTWPPLLLGGKGDPDVAALDREPRVAPLDRARVDTTVRGLADEAGDSVGKGWAPHVRTAATGRLAETGDELDRETGKVDLGGRLPVWLPVVRVLHWLLLLAFVGGLVWWGYAAIAGKSDDLSKVAGLPLPLVLAIAGLVLGLVLHVVGRALVGGLARARAEEADERLRAVVHRVVDAEVAQPVTREPGRLRRLPPGDHGCQAVALLGRRSCHEGRHFLSTTRSHRVHCPQARAAPGRFVACLR
ncbi:hypothetical protein [Nocardioides convexus]|uniref:hypothetical protein n=1 Tax=Nocardioides convexus TaxID=2712224 RepID=UPI002418A19D|nr:hypothetical protein [Nocardioides convexus]